MKRFVIAALAFASLTFPDVALAQTNSTKCVTAWKLDPIRKVLDDALAAPGPVAPEYVLNALLSDMSIKKLYERAQKDNLLTQLGATVDASSVSSLVTKAATSLLGFAFEYETAKKPESAPTESPTPPAPSPVPDAFTGTLVTFSGRPMDAIRQSVMGLPYMNGVVTSCDGRLMHIASKISVAGTFQVSGDINSSASVDQTNLKTFSLRYEIRNSRDPRGHYRATDLTKVAAFDPTNLPLEARTALAAAANDPAVRAWLDGIATIIRNLPEGAGSKPALLERAREEIGKLRPDTLAGFNAEAALQSALDSHLRGASDGFMHEASKGLLLTGELNFDATSVPDVTLYGLKFILAKSVTRNVELTANVSSQIGRKVTPAAGSAATPPAATDSNGYWRDAQLAAQLDVRLGTAAKNIGALSASGKAQYLGNKIKEMEPANSLEPGFVGYVQVKWSLPLNGVVITPFSVTWASRSTLINEAQIRGNVGISLNMDSLLAKFSQH